MEEKNVNEKDFEFSNEIEMVNEENELDVSETETLEVVTDILASSEKQVDEAQEETESGPMSEFEKDRAILQEINSRIPRREPILKTVGRNLKEKLSNILSIIYSSIAGVISLLGFLFFTSQKNGAVEEEVISSCEIMQVFFGAFLACCVIVLIVSTIMNIVRVKKNK